METVKKGINIWSFPVGMDIIQCMKLAQKAGFEGIELALNLTGELNLQTSDSDIRRLGQAADDMGLAINSLATGLYWQFSLTSNRQDIRERAKSIVRRQIDIAALLAIDCILVCPGTVGVDFKPGDVVPDAGDIEFFAGSEIIDYEIAYMRAQQSLRELSRYAMEKGVIIGIENIWNKFLLSPIEMRRFIDEIESAWVGVYFDVGNVMRTGYPDQWIKILGSRIKKIHFKDFRIDSHGLSGFVDLLAGDVDFIKVMEALTSINYRGWINAEMCPTYKLYSDQNIFNTSASMDRIFQRY